MELPLELPLDSDGFLRRECPSCLEEFKWHHGPTDGAPEAFIYPQLHFCPRCGRSAPLDAWWTRAQLEYQQEVVSASAGDILRQTMKGLGSTGLKFKTGSSQKPSVPDPLFEANDMMMIAPPCHAWEPVKVPAEARSPFYCLLCGQAYAL